MVFLIPRCSLPGIFHQRMDYIAALDAKIQIGRWHQSASPEECRVERNRHRFFYIADQLFVLTSQRSKENRILQIIAIGHISPVKITIFLVFMGCMVIPQHLSRLIHPNGKVQSIQPAKPRFFFSSVSQTSRNHADDCALGRMTVRMSDFKVGICPPGLQRTGKF